MRENKEKAFTLIELLAVIVIIAVVALITVPIITGVIENVKMAAFTRSVESAYKAFEIYRAQTQDKIVRIEASDERLPLDHNSFLSGTIMTVDNGEIEGYYLTDGNYCASGKLGSIDVKKGICEESFDAIGNFIMENYILTVNPNEGTWKEKSEVQNVNILMNEVNDLINPIRPGYKFLGWDMTVTGSMEEDNTGYLRTTLKANWEANTYKLLINPNAGTYEGSTSTKIVDIDAGEYYTLETPTRENYNFLGWEVSGENSSIAGSAFKMGSTDATVTAIWELNTFSLIVDADGGTWSGTTPQTLTIGDIVTIPNPTKTGYTFTGWTVTGTNSSMSGTTFTMGTSNTSIKANWTPITYTISYNLNGGSANNKASYNIETETFTLSIPTKSNYSFISWSGTGISGTSQSVTIIKGSTGNRNYTVNWGCAISSTSYTYTGSSQFIDDGNCNWRIKFLTSGDFKINIASASVDVFLVGGGGGGDSGGGGGGYTATYRNILVNNTSYQVGIGGGGVAAGENTPAGYGSASNAFGYSANGGGKGCRSGYSEIGCGYFGGSGGSGGGAMMSNGGSDGGNGAWSQYEEFGAPGSGQGTTTREFGESWGTLYAGGGGGGWYSYGGDGYGGAGGGANRATSAAPNTGGGGGGSGGSGGSGIVVIRNAR